MGETRQLMRVKFGSHLYGTATSSSDTDFKSVHLPSRLGILMCRPEQHIRLGTKSDTSRKNTAEDVDDESFSLQRYFEMLVKGDMMAYELLFAPPEALEYASPEWLRIRGVRHRLVSRQCKGFVGYCQRQAAKYGIKGSRMAAIRKALDLLDTLIATSGERARMGEFDATWTRFVAETEHSDLVNIPNPDGSEHWHVDICDRKMGYSVTLKTAQDVWSKVYDHYGHRARAAMANEGVDWKAISHAVRVGQQAVEVLSTGEITFPRPNRVELLQIKQGERSYDEVAQMLEALLSEVEHRAGVSQLQESSDTALMDEVVLTLHQDVIQGGPSC